MHIWELRYDVTNYAVLVECDDDEDQDTWELYTTRGKEKHWDTRPRLEPFIEKRKKTSKPRSDLSYFTAGTVILNEKAYQALKDFLLPFGQLLALDCKGETEYFYNVTNLIHCIDYARSEKEFDAVAKEVFLRDSVAEDAPLIFKDPHTAGTCIYLNQTGKEEFERIVAQAGLLGARFVEAGQGLL